MATIEWTNPAINDLHQIYNYVAQDSVIYANRLSDKLINRVEVLINFPNIGRIVPEFELDTLRELIEGNYRIVYEVQNIDLVRIIRIYHSKMNLTK